MKTPVKITLVSALALFMLAGCAAAPVSVDQTQSSTLTVLTAAQSGSAPDAAVSERDASGEYDEAAAVTLSPDGDLTITEAGTYLLTGEYSGMITVEVGKEEKVQLVLKNATLSNQNGPAIYVRSADKVFLTAAEGTVNTISDGASYTLTDGDTNLDAAVFSKDDLTINGAGKLTIRGNYKHAVVSKDDLVITAKDLSVSAVKDGLSGKESVTVSDAAAVITAGSDGVCSDEIAAVTGGTLSITAAEGIEATYVLISGGDITIQASDDGINAAWKSSVYTPTVEISGGTITITMGAGDTDGIDSNGDILISGGTIRVNGQSAFDYDGSASFTGGTVYVNGQQVSTLTNQMMGGGMGGFGPQSGMASQGGMGAQGGFGGGPGGMGGFGGRRG